MLHDEEFSSKAKVNRYGRRLPQNARRRDLERHYRFEGDYVLRKEGEDEEDAELPLKPSNLKVRESPLSVSEESSSDDDTESKGIEYDEEVFEFLDQAGENGVHVPMGEPSSRLAVVNLDWDNIRAADLLAVFSSFTPTSGAILRVSVYPSEFGRERMEKEEIEGPPKDIFSITKSQVNRNVNISEPEDDAGNIDDIDDENIKQTIVTGDQGQEVNSAKLRRYQLERLRYYYAVLTFSSISAAKAVYDAIDGAEYLTTANFFDLRFIPDEVDFSSDQVRDECTVIPDKYRPNEFVTDALQHSKVRLTWDADDGRRKEAQKKAFTGSRAELDENDLKAYLGSESSSDEASEPVIVDSVSPNPLDSQVNGNQEPFLSKISRKEVERQRMRKLLGLEDESKSSRKTKIEHKPIGDMQITFSSGFISEPSNGAILENVPPANETTMEKYIRKERERKAKRTEITKQNRKAIAPEQNTKDQPADQTEPTTSLQSPSSSTKDLGFSDPFFADSQSKRGESSNKPAKPPFSDSLSNQVSKSASTAELELLMLPDDAGSSIHPPINHFSMRETALIEKALTRRKRGLRLSRKEKTALADAGRTQNRQYQRGSEFEMDVHDPRFSAVYERPEFAIDPAHPRFSGTGEMRRLLDEGRRARAGSLERGEDEEKHGKRPGIGENVGVGKKGKDKRDKIDDAEQVQGLVNRVKRRMIKS